MKVDVGIGLRWTTTVRVNNRRHRRGCDEHITTVRKLAKHLADVGAANRAVGAFDAQPVLIAADAGCGKSWLMAQLQYDIATLAEAPSTSTSTSSSSSSSSPSEPAPSSPAPGPQTAAEAEAEALREGSGDTLCMLPLLVQARVLGHLLASRRGDGDGDDGDDDDVDVADESGVMAKFLHKYHHPQWEKVLSIALRLRTLVVLVDGLEEVQGEQRDAVERFVLHRWVGLGGLLAV